VFFRRYIVLTAVLLVSSFSFGTTPQVTSTNPTSGPTGTQVQINGSGFGATQGSSAVNFNASYPAAIISWSDTQIVATVPSQAFTGQVVVVVGGVWSNQSVYFNVPAPQITSISPASGVIGTQVTINGSGFQGTKGGNSSISFNGIAGTINNWGDTQIIATVAANSTSGAVKISVNGVSSNQDQVFMLPNPIISGLTPSSGPVGTSVQISGSGFGSAQGNSIVQFHGVGVTPTAWSDSSITATVPSTATSGTVQIIVGGIPTPSNVSFAIPPPQVTSISPTIGPANTQLTVTGSGFQATKGASSALLINGTSATTTSWTDTQIIASIPSSASTGPVCVSVNNVRSNQDVAFTIPNPIINLIAPSIGAPGTLVTVTGTGFGATQSNSTLKFLGIAATDIHSWADSQIVATVPTAAVTGYIQVTVLGVSSHAGDVNFTVPVPQITSISPNSGAPGASVTINGSGFRSSQLVGSNNSTVSFNGLNATATSWSDNKIVATVPTAATSGPVVVGGSIGSSNADIAFTTANPVVTLLSPSSTPVNHLVQINGSGFGSTQGSVTISGVSATIQNWFDTHISVTVPATSKSGAVVVTTGGISSNNNLILTVPPPQITSITPTSGIAGALVTVNGSGFQPGPQCSGCTIGFLNGLAFTVVNWSDTQIVATVPHNAGVYPVQVTVNGVASNSDVTFTLPNPVVTSFSPVGGAIGAHVVVNGTGFGATQGSSTVSFNFTNATSILNWSDTSITALVPTGATTGSVRVSVGGITSGTGPAFLISNLFVNAVSPAAGPIGTPITVTGNGFGTTQGTVSFNNVAATTISSWTDSQIIANVPTGATTGAVKVTVGSVSSIGNPTYTVGPASVTGVSPAGGLPGTQFQISGSGFGATQGTSSVSINGSIATVGPWSDMLITATVPSSATSGAVKVTVGGLASNTNVNFNVTTPVITGISPSSGPPTTPVQISGSGFGGSQGTTSNFSFNGANASGGTWSDTLITTTVPSTATSGRVWVKEGNVFSNLNLNFTVPAPQIVSISPASGVVGTRVTITGTGFGSQGSNNVLFNGNTASNVIWGDTQIMANVPAGAKTGPVTITGSNQDVVFTMPNPIITSLSPSVGPAVTTTVQILGSGFGATQGTSILTFNKVGVTPSTWSDTSITAVVPSNITSGIVAVNVGGVGSTPNISFTVPLPHITSVSPNSSTPGTQVTVTGSGFQSQQGAGLLSFSGPLNGFSSPAIINSWSDTQIIANVPANVFSGPISVTQTASSNRDVEFQLISPRVTGVGPSTGPVGTQVQINGAGFGATQGSSSLQISGVVTVPISWSDSQIVAAVPSTSHSGAITVFVAGISSNVTVNFTVPTPRITNISPAAGSVGSVVTITGSGFQAAQGGGFIEFNTAGANPQSWSDTQIVVAVPAGATSGAVTVATNNGNVANQNMVFTLPNPIVSNLVPASGPTGTHVQINGSGFGATQGGNTVTFNAIAASVVSWSDTQITAIVPYTATSGPVAISEGGVTSNMGIDFNVPAPQITSISPAIGGVGNPITINGTGFQSVRGFPTSYYVGFSGSGGTAAIKSWSDTQIVAVVPTGTTTGFLNVNINSASSNYVNYTIPSQTIASLSPTTGPVGTQVTVAGTAFGASQGTSVLSFNGQPATVSSWTNSQIIATVPVTSAAGPAIVTIGGVNSNAVLFTVPPPFVGNFLPSGGVSGTQITINGTGFQPTQRDSTLAFNGTPATVSSWSNTQIVATVPASATTGPLVVTVNGAPSPGVSFEVPHPTIAGITPAEAPANGVVTITGSGFGTSNMYSPDGISVTTVGFINFNGVTVGALSWSDTSITTRIPSNGTSGPVTVLKYDATSNSIPLTIEGAPTVTGLAPSVGPIGESVIISGSGFGSAQTTSAVQFNGVPATVSAWSDTQITANVPPGAATGPVNVTVATVGGPTSTFTVNTSVQIVDSLGHSSSYTSAMIGGSWVGTDATGSGCTSCTLRGTIHDDYDPATGDLTAHTDELGRITNNAYDANSNLTSTTVHLDPSTPVQTTYTYNSFGEPLTVTDPLGNVTTNTYDANGNLLTVTSPVPATGVAASVTQFAYDTKGQLTQITDPLSHSTTLAYYPTGLIHTITDAQSNVTSYEYDSRGNRTAVVDAQSNRTTFAYDAGNRLTGITYPDSTTVSFVYDSRGRRTTVTDQNSKVTSYAYDDADRLTSVTDAALNVTHYTYDLENNLLSITDAAGHTTSFVYDAFGRVTQTAFPSSLTENYVYDAIGNLTSKTDRKNQTILYVYDALDRLSHKGYPDATGVDYLYDLAGKIKQVTDPTGSYGFAYDNMGRLIGTTTQYSFLPGNTYTNSYGYDAASNRASFTAPDGSTNTYAYDTLGRLSTLTNSLTGQFGFTYDSLSRRTALNRPNGVNTSYSYDSVSRLLNVLHKAGGATLDGAGYAYDNAGNRTAKTNYLNSVTENYTYDPTYQLTQVTQGTTTTESYSYDAAGNRISSSEIGSNTYSISNELLSTPTATYTYDNNGNTLSKTDSNGTTLYTWNYKNQLVAVILPNGNGSASFTYDPNGHRIQKLFTQGSNTTTTNYLYSDGDTVEELDQNGNLRVRYTPGGLDEHLAMQRSGVSDYFEQDALTSVTSLTGAYGGLTRSYIYDTFGNVLSSTGSQANSLEYTGRDTDSEIGLRYYRARYYDPATGRFFSEDPLQFESGDNFYEYSFNSPTNYNDPSGLNSLPVTPLPPPWTVLEGGAGAAGGAGIGTLLATGGLIGLDTGLASYDTYLSMQLCLAYGVKWCSPAQTGTISPVRSPGAPPQANKDCPDCIRLMQEIKRLMAEIQNRIDDLLSDPKELYDNAHYLPNPSVTGTDTTYQGHIGKVQNKQNELKKKLLDAIRKNCPIPPGAWPLAMRGTPNKPRGR
jgi:RHS repeat-associated protein